MLYIPIQNAFTYYFRYRKVSYCFMYLICMSMNLWLQSLKVQFLTIRRSCFVLSSNTYITIPIKKKILLLTKLLQKNYLMTVLHNSRNRRLHKLPIVLITYFNYSVYICNWLYCPHPLSPNSIATNYYSSSLEYPILYYLILHLRFICILLSLKLYPRSVLLSD